MKRNLFGYVVKSAWAKSGLLSIAAIAMTWAVQPEAAQAISLSFTPAGANLNDGDDIRDRQVTPGQELIFKVNLAVDALAEDETLKSVSYQWEFDSTELNFVSFMPSIGGICQAVGGGTCGAASNQVDITGLALGAGSYEVGQVKFNVTTDLSKLISDNSYDFRTRLITAFSSSDDDLLDGPSTNYSGWQQMEVQPRSVPTPALLPGLIALGVGARRKRKNANESVA